MSQHMVEVAVLAKMVDPDYEGENGLVLHIRVKWGTSGTQVILWGACLISGDYSGWKSYNHPFMQDC
jgi:hypothetical protein